MSRQYSLLTWVRQQHKGQLIKRTTEPYVNHLTAVAGLAGIVSLGYEIGLCHDLFEDTQATAQQLQAALAGFGYSDEEALVITGCVTELTNVFTKKGYPGLSKTARKKKEAVRLINISPTAQTVKYADLIYNIGWMLHYNQKHARKYLQKKRLLLTLMINGDGGLRHRALTMIDEALSA